MLGLPAEAIQTWANAAYIIAIVVAAALTILIYQSSAIVVANKDEALERYKAEAQVEVERARAASEQARKDASEANQLAASAQERAATLEKEATALRLKIAQITTPRQLSSEQVERLTALLGPLPKGKVVVKGRWEDAEATMFALQISEIVSKAGFEVIETFSSQHVLSMGNVGVTIFVNDMRDPPRTVAAMQSAFRAIGIEAPAFGAPTQVPEKDVFWIMIGTRY